MTRPNDMNKATPCDYAAWILAVASILFVLYIPLLPALIAGLLVYELVHVITPLFARRLSTRRAKAVAIALVALLVIGTVSAVGFGLIVFMRSEGGSLPALLAKMADVLDASRTTLPQWLADYLPNSSQGISDTVSRWLRGHAVQLQSIGTKTGHSLAHVLIGMIIGAMVSLREAFADGSNAPLARALAERIFRMGEAFRRVVFAQIRISALNTAFTTIYLAIALPLLDIHMPLTKTMIAATFIAGLLPVVGNLISNSVIVVISMAVSPQLAISSLCYLVFIHKLEYLLNARIVGTQINARAWELLTAMLVMESAFGLPGLIAAPICYAWLKDELCARGLI